MSYEEKEKENLPKWVYGEGEGERERERERGRERLILWVRC